jgi:hypothetical protein
MATSARTRVVAISVIAVLLLGLVGITVVRAQDAPQLPPVRADELLASTLTALERPVSISGDVQTRLDLGLPEVPASLGGEGGAIAMIGGTQRFRIWHSTDGLRVAHILDVSEQDLIVNPHEAWWWDAADLTATHVSLDGIGAGLPQAPLAGDLVAGGRPGPGAAMAADPLDAARAALRTVAPFAHVEVRGTTVVAGRDAYELVMVPTSTGTLVGRIVVAIDAQRHIPLGLQVFPRGSDTDALSVGFTSVSFDAIDPAMFTFEPPPGATVVDGHPDHEQAGDLAGTGSPFEGTGRRTPVVLGSGFETRVAIPVSNALPADLQRLLPYGGQLVSAVFTRTSSGAWLLVGSVPVETLQRDADRLP